MKTLMKAYQKPKPMKRLSHPIHQTRGNRIKLKFKKKPKGDCFVREKFGHFVKECRYRK